MDYLAIINLIAALAARAPHVVDEVRAIVKEFENHHDAGVAAHATATVAAIDEDSQSA